MGKVTKMAEEIRGKSHGDLLERFKRIVRAQGILEYTDAKKDMTLDIEVNLTGEEIIRRMAKVAIAI